MYKRSSWTFSKEVSEKFEQHVRKSLPFYDRLQEMIVSLSDYFVNQHGVIYDLGTATGETIHRLHERHRDKKLHYIGLDASKSMIEKAKNKNLHVPNAEFIVMKLEDYQFPSSSSFILSVLTLHFLPIPQRKLIIQRVYDSLEKGGCFILVEKTFANFPATQHLFTHMQYDEKLNEGFTYEEILLKEQSLRGVLIPLTVQENLEMLASIGFDVDIFFKHWHFTGFIATKPMQ